MARKHLCTLLALVVLGACQKSADLRPVAAPAPSLAPLAVVSIAAPPPANGNTAVAALPAIRVSDNGRYFVKADGTPFFWLGDTAWCIFNHATPADVDLYLDDRKAKGFTVIQGCIAVWDFNSRANPDGQMPFNGVPRMGRGGPGAPPATTPAPAAGNPTINEAFFKNVDAIIDKAAARGMYMAILPFWTKNTRSGPFNDPAVMGPYCEYLAKRYASKNVFFVLGGDSGADQILPVVNAEAAGLLKGAKEAGIPKIMITYHPTGRQTSSMWFQNSPWLDFDSMQSGHFINTTNFQMIANDFAKQPVKPTLDMEPGYENITNNLVRTNVTGSTPRIQAVDVRRGAYLAVFAGAAGHTYGNGEVYEFYHVPANGGPPPGNAGWHANMEWKDALKLPASGQLQYLRYLIESRPTLERVPDQTLIAGTVSNRALDRIEATRGSSGDYAFVYLPTGQSKVTIQTGKLAGKTLTAWWYDPRTGKAEKAGDFPKTDTHDFTIPATKLAAGTDDWVLVLDNAEKNFPAPGSRP